MKDAIAALSSTEGATDIVRASGDGILKLCSTEFLLPQKPTFHAHPVTLRIETPWGEADFHGVALLFRKNRSYTKEEMVELHLGRGFGRAALRRLFERGVRHAKAGEFTMRAFLNGRITLAQAEAINALVRAQTQSQRRQASAKLLFATPQKLRKVYNTIQSIRADIEAQLDFPDEEIDAEDLKTLSQRIRSLREEIKTVSSKSNLPNLPRVLITGPPNAGKSSLLNRIVGRDVALVHSTAGTTRDWIEVETRIRGRRVLLVDTPGEAEPFKDLLTTLKKEADLQIKVVGAEQISPQKPPKPPERGLLVVNKADLRISLKGVNALFVSALTGEGIEGLKEEIKARLPEVSDSTGGVVEEVRALLKEAERLLEGEMELAAEVLRDAADELATTLNTNATEGLLERIFGRFCIGK